MDDLAKLSAAATQGMLIHCGWGDGSTYEGMTNIFNEDAEVLLMECIPVGDAAFIVALVNAYRSGELVPASELAELREKVARLEGVLSRRGFMMTEPHNPGGSYPRSRKLVIGFENGDDADDAIGAINDFLRTARAALGGDQ